MWELDYKESWVLKNWCLWTVVLEKALESPSDGKEIKPVNPKGNQSWTVTGWTDAEADSCCSPWGRKESDMTELLNSNKTLLHDIREYNIVNQLPPNWK